MTTVYRAFDAAGRLLYVGCTGSFQARIYGHERTSPWFPDVASWTRDEYHYYYDAAVAEAEAIRTEDPLYNIMGNPKYRSPGGKSRPPYARSYGPTEATP